MATMSSRHALLLALALGMSAAQYNPAPVGRPDNMPEISNLEVMCGKDHMTVQLGFVAPFQGLVFSKGQFNSPNCVYVKPYTGLGAYTFDIYYNKCGTKPDLNGKFYENTIIVQYDNELIEVWDEAKRLRCEWYNDYEKTATKPPVVIADLEVIELDFRGDNVDCWMEIQDGKGPWASPVTGIVPLGSTLTMVVAINDPNAEFDMRVKECEASDGKGRPIYLSDENGCVLRPKMISKFTKLRSNDGRSTVITYAHFHAFKFPDSMYVHLKCKVEICRYGCPDHCQKAVAGGYAAPVAAQYSAPEARGYDDAGGQPAASQYTPVVSNALDESTPEVEEMAPVVVQAVLAEEYQSAPAPVEEYQSAPAPVEEYQSAPAPVEEYQSAPAPVEEYQSAPAPVAQQLQQSGPTPTDSENYGPPHGELAMAVPKPASRPGPKFRGGPRRRPQKQKQQRRRPGGRRPPHKRVQMVRPSGGGHSIRGIPLPLPPRGGVNRNNMPDDLPPLPAHLQPVLFAPSTRDVLGKPEAIPVPFETDGRQGASNVAAGADGGRTSDAGLGGVDRSEFPWGPRQLKIRRRRYVVDEPEAKAADIGVGSTLEVISENDLQFEPTYEDNQRVTIFQGQIRDDIVYGICLPAAGFSALFVLLAMCAVISVLVAGFLCHHRQVQKDSSRQPAAMPLRDWNMVHFLRQRFHPAQ